MNKHQEKKSEKSKMSPQQQQPKQGVPIKDASKPIKDASKPSKDGAKSTEKK